MIIFPRRQWNVNNLVTAHLADNPPPFCVIWRPMKLFIHTWNFCKNYFFYSPVSLLFEFPTLSAPPRPGLNHCPGPPCDAECNALLWAVHTHTLCSFIECCVSQKCGFWGGFYIIFMFLRHMRDHSQPDRREMMPLPVGGGFCCNISRK